MTHEERRLARLLQQLEGRVTDLEQGRPPDAPEHLVETVQETGVEVGEPEYGLSFGGIGTDHHVDIVDLPDYDEFSVNFWMRADQIEFDSANNFRRLIHADPNWIILEEGRSPPDGAISFRVPGVDTSNFTGGSILLDEAVPVWCAYDGSDRIIYVRGEEAARETIGSGTVDITNVSFGTVAVGFDQHTFNGELYDVGYYNRAPTASEVADHADGQDIKNGRVSHWPLNEASGSTATDVVGSNDGNIVGPGWVRSDVSLGDTGLTVEITEKTDYYFEYDVAGNGYDEAEWVGDLVVPAGTTYTVESGAPERYPGADVDGTLVVNGTLILDG